MLWLTPFCEKGVPFSHIPCSFKETKTLWLATMSITAASMPNPTVICSYYNCAHCIFHKWRQRWLLHPYHLRHSNYSCHAPTFSWGDTGNIHLHRVFTESLMARCCLETSDWKARQVCGFHDLERYSWVFSCKLVHRHEQWIPLCVLKMFYVHIYIFKQVNIVPDTGLQASGQCRNESGHYKK